MDRLEIQTAEDLSSLILDDIAENVINTPTAVLGGTPYLEPEVQNFFETAHYATIGMKRQHKGQQTDRELLKQNKGYRQSLLKAIEKGANNTRFKKTSSIRKIED